MDEGLEKAYETAKKARKRGFDPKDEPEIPLAEDLAARVEKLAGPEGVAEAIRDLEKDYSREDLTFKIAEMIVDDEFGHLSDSEAAEQSVRTCLAIITEGVAAAAPIEGITKVDIKENFDGSLYLAIYFAGPIRSAGGTAAALAVLLGDFVRRKMNLSSYEPSDLEVERFVEEVNIYGDTVGLQYTPREDEVREAYQNIPVEVTGEPTEQEVVTGYRNLERVETNRVRGGAVLAIAEGVLQKAPKILKHLDNLGLGGWEWLSDLQKPSSSEEEEKQKYPKGDKYLKDIIAGRAVFSHPGRPGGFRLRYGRARNTGLAAAGVHPATMRILDDHISTGIQLKTERPGKATAVSPVDSIEGPTVLLKDGSVIRLDSASVAKDIKDDVKEILSLGDILFGYGEFLENNHPLMPSGYCQEWWSLEVKKELKNKDFEEDLAPYLEPPFETPSPGLALEVSRNLDVPLHPDFTFNYHDLEIEEIERLGNWLASCDASFEGEILGNLRGNLDKDSKRMLEVLEVPHDVEGDEIIIGEESLPLCESLGLVEGENLNSNRLSSAVRENSELDTVDLLNLVAGFPIREKAPTRIGARMGRPEKTNPRKMSPPPHVLFPIGWAGGNTRNVGKASDKENVQIEVAHCECPECGEVTILNKCPSCGTRTEMTRYCTKCERPSKEENCVACGGRATFYREREVDLKSFLNDALGRLEEGIPGTLKGVKGMTSAYKLPEPLEKGILRSKHDVYVFKDGTIRFDATDLPLTHFYPREIDVSVERLREMGYTEDYRGDPLENENQILELKVQDILLSKSATGYLLKTAQFVDDLLEKFYDLPPFYNANEKEDLIGHLVIGLAPHTSAGITGRIIGFSEANVGYAHPYFHAAKRRNCFNYDHRVFFYDESVDKFVTSKVGELVENRFQNKEPIPLDNFGTEKVCSDGNLYAYVLDRESGKLVKKPINCFIRGRTEKWVNITTSTNRELKVTPGHNISVMEDGELRVKKAIEISEGDRIPISLKTPIETKIDNLNLARELSTLEEEKLMQIRIRNVEEFFVQIMEEIGKKKLYEICGGAKSFPKSLSDWYKSVPLLHFKKICSEGVRDYEDLPKDAKLGIRRDSVALPCYIEDILSLFWLLGMYCAEGWSRSTESSHQVSFRIGNERLRERVKSAIKSVFGLDPYEKNGKLTYSSKILRFLISNVWNAGSSAYEKKVPEIVYHGDDEKVKAFLSAYFDGDGSISLSPDRVTFYSVSKKLLEGISNLLLRVDVFSRYLRTGLREPGRTVARKYKKRGKEPVEHRLYHLVLTGEDRYKFASYVQPVSEKKRDRASKMAEFSPENAKRLINYKGKNYEATPSSDYTFDVVKGTSVLKTRGEKTYCIDVDGEEILDKNVLWHNQLVQLRCDGDEDAIMLLLDGLLNFSRYYLPETRGGKMDAPLVLTPHLDPSEIDDEAHNLDVDEIYPLEFYEASLLYENPSKLSSKIGIAENRLGTEEQYKNLSFSEAHNPTSISAGPTSCRYKSLGPMEEKTDSQLSLARKIRAVDESDVVERLIENHFIPDLKGNLRAFSRQKFRCASCNSKYRRVPLTGKCTNCGENLILTVTKGGVEKYIDVARRVAGEYGASQYTKQRLRLVEEEIESVFVSDIKEQLSLADFV